MAHRLHHPIPSPQRRRGVEGRHQPSVPPRIRLATHPADAGIRLEKELRCEIADGHHHQRVDEHQLAAQITLARLGLGWEGVPVARRAALEGVGYIDVAIAVEPDLLEEAVEQLPGGADERKPLLVLVVAGGLSDHHHRRIRRASGEHRLGPRLAKVAGDAHRRLFGEETQLGRRRGAIGAHGAENDTASQCMAAKPNSGFS